MWTQTGGRGEEMWGMWGSAVLWGEVPEAGVEEGASGGLWGVEGDGGEG